VNDFIPLGALVALVLFMYFGRQRINRLGMLLLSVVAAGLGWWVVTHTHWLLLAGLALLGLLAALGQVVRATRTAATVTRWGARTRKTAGVATNLDIARAASSVAMRRKAPSVRPSMGGLSRREMRRMPVREFAIKLALVGVLRVYASIEDVITVFGGPRTGKTGWLAGKVIDAPGAVLSTSTRLDLMELTAALRAEGGRPVWVFNPGGLGGIESTIGFDPLLGCADPVTATERAADMIPESDGPDQRGFWEGQARRVLGALMHAAALDQAQKRTMRDVLAWVADPDEHGRLVTLLLRRSPEPSFEHDIQQFITTNKDTRTSTTSSVMPALSWLNSSAATAATEAPAFDVEELLKARGAVYLLGRHEAHTAPLLAALTGYIAREARRLAAYQPGGRLDPPLTLALDEAARVAPVPLPDWSGDAGGSGITIIAAFQSRADLVDRWGPTGADKVLNNSGAAMLFGGTKSTADLEVWSKLAGDRDEPVISYGPNGKVTSRSVRKTPVLSASQLANLPTGRVVVFRRGMPPAVGRVEMAWRRRDVRKSSRASRAGDVSRKSLALPGVREVRDVTR
jgi:type IV secretion system protein VirD4